jgi:tetratricopeptide (TPR) repeat protein
VVASLLDELRELQPLIKKLTDHWLGTDASDYSQLPVPKEEVWRTIVETSTIKQLLTAGGKSKFTSEWSNLAFNMQTPQSRIGVITLGQKLAERLFPHEQVQDVAPDSSWNETDLESGDQREEVVSTHEAFERVKKQIAAIAESVSQGNDAKAEKFLRDLIDEQTSFSRGENFAVKSLCNIAQQCAEMFRMDFEKICLDEAQRLLPTDSWTKIQYGDHLKRIGRYDEALEILDKITQSQDEPVAESAVADVFSQKGDYETAIERYKAISNWGETPSVLTAIADNLRKMGRLDDAELEYKNLVNRAQRGEPDFADCWVRPKIGIAEVEKRRGNYDVAARIYKEVLDSAKHDDRDRTLYRLGLCNILKAMERFDEAYQVVDEVIQEYPHAMEARFLRGSILGLIGKEKEGLSDIPEGGDSRSWREWLRRYYRGLLLFKLNRYEDARQNLVEELSFAVASGEEKAILRMAAALWYLRDGDTPKADSVLSEIPDLQDPHTQYLALVLKMHSAAEKKDLRAMENLKTRINDLQIEDAGLESAVVALFKGDLKSASNFETDALLKIAA